MTEKKFIKCPKPDLTFSPKSYVYSKKNIIMRELMGQCRRGQFIEFQDILKSLTTEYVLKKSGKEKVDNSVSNLKGELTRNLLYRAELTGRDGEDSVAHLAITHDTLNMLSRLNEAADINVLTISGVRSFMAGGCSVFVKEGLPVPVFLSSNSKDLADAIREFDALKKRDTANI